MARASTLSKKSSKPTSAANPYWELLRPLNALMSAVGVFIGYSIAVHAFTFNLQLLYAMLSVFLISGAGQAINDYFDADVDRKKKSTRPIPSGRIEKQQVLLYALLLFVLGIVLSSFLNPLAFQIAVFFSLLLFLYSALMKQIKFFGNVIVATSVGFTFIFGASVYTITPLVLMVALSGFFANWTREIIKDVEDKHADEGEKISLAHVLNAHSLNYIVLVLLLITFAAGYLPTLLGGAPWFYTLLVTASNLIFILAGKEFLAKHAGKSAGLMKKAMLVGLLAQLSLVL